MTPRRIRIRDVAPRLAFQAHPATTAQKVETINRLIRAGVPAIEVSSFVRPDLVPGLADAADVFARIDRTPGLSLECCVGNIRGLQSAVDAGADVAWFLLSADDGFAQDNIGRSTTQSLADLEQMRSLADAAGITLGTYIIFAWGGPTGLARGPQDLAPLARRLVDIGVTRWILADSTGYAAPPQTHDLIEAAAQHVPMEELTVQIHDGRGMGMANVVAALEAGVINIDTALGGSGGHPAMQGTPGGGVCTEDLVQMLNLMGIETGIDLPELIDTANWLETALSVPSKGFVRTAGAVPTGAGEVARTGTFQWSQ